MITRRGKITAAAVVIVVVVLVLAYINGGLPSETEGLYLPN